MTRDGLSADAIAAIERQADEAYARNPGGDVLPVLAEPLRRLLGPSRTERQGQAA